MTKTLSCSGTAGTGVILIVLRFSLVEIVLRNTRYHRYQWANSMVTALSFAVVSVAMHCGGNAAGCSHYGQARQYRAMKGIAQELCD
jgi:hypothetical protein